MYLNASLFTKHMTIINNSLYPEFEFEDNGLLLRVISCQPYDGNGTLRVNEELQPTRQRQLYLNKLHPPYRLRDGIMYRMGLSLKFQSPLPTGMRAVVEISNWAANSGLHLTSKKWDGTEESWIFANSTQDRIIELDGHFPVGVLRFVKVNTTGKKTKKGDDSDNGDSDSQ